MVIDNKEISRRGFIVMLGAGAGTLVTALLWPHSKPDSNSPIFENTKFYGKVTTVVSILGEGWRVKTAPVTPEYGANKCLVFNNSQDWMGCVEAFNGFASPLRPQGFQPAAFLVYAWKKNPVEDHITQEIFVAQPVEAGLPLASGKWQDGSLMDDSMIGEQRDAAKRFGFTFPPTDDFNPTPMGSTGPIGFWALNAEELSKIKDLNLKLP